MGRTAVGVQGVEPGVGNAGLISCLVEGSGCVAVSDEVVAIGDKELVVPLTKSTSVLVLAEMMESTSVRV